MEADDRERLQGAWVGIDFGTSNCCVAVWDTGRSRCKRLRLGWKGLARPPNADGSALLQVEKGGRIVPSAVLFFEDGESFTENMDDTLTSPCDTAEILQDLPASTKIAVGHAALVAGASLAKHRNDNTRKESLQETEGKESQEEMSHCDEGAIGLIRSIKRILGLSSHHIRQELMDTEFFRSLPYEIVLSEDEGGVNDDGAKERVDKDAPPTKEPDGMASLLDEDEVITVAAGSDVVIDSGARKNASSVNESILSKGPRQRPGDNDDVRIRIRSRRDETMSSKAQTATEVRKAESISPTQIAALLLRSIRLAAEHYLNKTSRGRRIHPLGKNDGETLLVRNCVVGVPAHYGRSRRQALLDACRLAGFHGHISAVTESTAASLAYGFFVSPATSAVSSPIATQRQPPGRSSLNSAKTVLVFDMGGGTTDVTISTMSWSEDGQNDVSCRVTATAGDARLGGDDMDEMLAQYVWNHRDQGTKNSPLVTRDCPIPRRLHNRLRQRCQKAKEELCGDGSLQGEGGALSETIVEIHYEDNGGGKENARVVVTREDFESIVAPLVQRAQVVVERALASHQSSIPGNSVRIDEVVLVGGASRVPAVRRMLRQKFPPPNPPDLSISINPESAVAEGAAIKAAMVSKLLPQHELRSAMMLDALPHTLGVLVSTTSSSHDGVTRHQGNRQEIPNGVERFVPIVWKDSPLPARGFATFTLADIDQKGVTVVAAEDVGDGLPPQRMGVFTFLLHRLTAEQRQRLAVDDLPRQIDVGMIVDADGRFIVSIFDSNDPEHLAKKKRYQEQQRKIGNGEKGADGDPNEVHAEDNEDMTSWEQIFLLVVCVVVFLLYVSARVAFAAYRLEVDGDDKGLNGGNSMQEKDEL